jgi:hypothetical protein
MAVACAAYAQPARPEMPPAKPLERADNHLDVVYLPQRQVGAWEDRWLRMNVHVPAGGGPFPCIVFVHGGGYGGGDKDGGLYGAGPPPRELLQRAVDEGYAAVNLNYILGRGTRPQVFWDYKAAIRFLRANAGRFKLDPGRIAAWGFSAGGWLASTAGFSGPEDSYACPPAAQNIDELSRQRPKGDVFPVQMDDPRAANAEFSSRVSAIVADLWQGLQYLSADDPPMLTYVGEGALHKHADAAREAHVDFTAIELTDPKYKGQSSLHVPPHTAAARRLDGRGTSTLADEVFAWLACRLRQQPRSIPPEAQPNRRTFADHVEVRLVAPAPDARIHFTTDGLEPGLTSPVFDKPLVLTGTTTIRAITVCQACPERSRRGERPSGVAAFTFSREDPPPEILAPEGPLLPRARVGRPYEVRFKASGGAELLWNLAGHLEIGKEPNKAPSDPAGLRLNPVTGVLSGTPTSPGVFSFQVQAAAGPGRPADARVYVLVIEP